MKEASVVKNNESGRVTYPKHSTCSQGYSSIEVTLSEYAKTICPKPLPIFDIVPLLVENLVIQTPYLKTYRKPISLLYLGNAGSGKSRLFTPLMKLNNVNYTNDITPKYLVEFLGKVKNGNKNYLAIPDFIHCTSHSIATRTTLTSLLRSMTEEGVIDLSDYHLEFNSKTPVKAGLITATTEGSYADFAREWKKRVFCQGFCRLVTLILQRQQRK